MDSTRFKQLISAITEEYKENFSELRIKQWWQALKDYSSNDVEQAYMAYLSSQWCMKAPKPGNLISLITGTEKQQQLTVEDKALSAWNEILLEIRRVGVYGNLDIDDKVALKSVQSIGGWKTICHSTEDALKTWKRKEFISAYHTFVGATNLPSSLAGIGQRNNDKLESQKQLANLQERLKSKI